MQVREGTGVCLKQRFLGRVLVAMVLEEQRTEGLCRRMSPCGDNSFSPFQKPWPAPGLGRDLALLVLFAIAA